MITTFIGDDNKEHNIVTQNYEIGTYFIIDSNPSEQGGSELSEIEIHKKIREKYKFIAEKSTKL